MPNYRTHVTVNLLAMIPLANMSINNGIFDKYFWGSYLIGTFAVTPDLDMKNSGPDKSLGRIWNSFWDFYNIKFKHRQISHSPVIGTLSRYLYLLWIPILVTLANYNWNLNIYIALYGQMIFASFCGLMTSDNIHILLDEISTWWKKL